MTDEPRNRRLERIRRELSMGPSADVGMADVEWLLDVVEERDRLLLASQRRVIERYETGITAGRLQALREVEGFLKKKISANFWGRD
jgi:hypothetical protein